MYWYGAFIFEKILGIIIWLLRWTMKSTQHCFSLRRYCFSSSNLQFMINTYSTCKLEKFDILLVWLPMAYLFLFRKLSPIFVSFLSIPLQRMLGFQNSHHLLAQAPRQYAHLVDAGKPNYIHISMDVCLSAYKSTLCINTVEQFFFS